MADTMIMTPVKEDDPCGEDLRWDMEFMTVMQDFETLFLQEEGGVVEGETAAGGPDAREYLTRVNRLCARTKDLRLLGIRAEVLWRTAGLATFADAMEDLVAASEAWPDPEAGIHPRADEYDGDLGERTAPLTRLLHGLPVLARTVGWRVNPSPEQRQATLETLTGIFDSWTARLEPAFAGDLPSRTEAWSAIRDLMPAAEPAAAESDAPGELAGGAAAFTAAPAPADAWDLVEKAGELMAEQDRHSPAVPVLNLMLIWRSKGLLEIAEAMKPSGLTMEQLLDSIRKQLAAENR